MTTIATTMSGLGNVSDDMMLPMPETPPTTATPTDPATGTTSAPTSTKDIIKKIEEMMEASNLANLERYEQGLAELTGSRDRMREGYARAEELMAGTGESARQAIGELAQTTQATGTQDLITRGLGNTTITGALARGVASDKARNLLQLQEQEAMQKAGLAERGAMGELAATGPIASFIEARSDIGPDVGLYADLMKSLQGEEVGDGTAAVTDEAGGGASDIFPPSNVVTPPCNPQYIYVRITIDVRGVDPHGATEVGVDDVLSEVLVTIVLPPADLIVVSGSPDQI